jgi:hypothetical protein
MHARYYASSAGRFLSVDPVLGDLHQPQTWNRYTYTSNNPLRYADPDGRCAVDGEQHGTLWCWAHSLGFVQTDHEHAESIRTDLASQGIVIWQGNQPLNTTKMSDRQVLAAYEHLLEQDRNGKMSRPDLSAASFLTQWGWNSQQPYRQARKEMDQPGTHQALNGKVPTQEEAVRMIEENGGKIDRMDIEGHPPGGVSDHTYPHINYTTSSGVKATVKVLP